MMLFHAAARNTLLGREAVSAASAYNRNVTWRHVSFVLAAVLLPGCGNRAVQNEAAVRQGILDHLSQRSDLNLSTMQVDVTSVSFRENEADANVSFRPKGAAAETSMTMRYTLERKGDRRVVKGRGQSQAGHAPHGMGQPPQGMSGGSPQGGAGLPPGHPPIGRPSSDGR
jgi:hypothetical protein